MKFWTGFGWSLAISSKTNFYFGFTFLVFTLNGCWFLKNEITKNQWVFKKFKKIWNVFKRAKLSKKNWTYFRIESTLKGPSSPLERRSMTSLFSCWFLRIIYLHTFLFSFSYLLIVLVCSDIFYYLNFFFAPNFLTNKLSTYLSSSSKSRINSIKSTKFTK